MVSLRSSFGLASDSSTLRFLIFMPSSNLSNQENGGRSLIYSKADKNCYLVIWALKPIHTPISSSFL